MATDPTENRAWFSVLAVRNSTFTHPLSRYQTHLLYISTMVFWQLSAPSAHARHVNPLPSLHVLLPHPLSSVFLGRALPPCPYAPSSTFPFSSHSSRRSSSLYSVSLFPSLRVRVSHSNTTPHLRKLDRSVKLSTSSLHLLLISAGAVTRCVMTQLCAQFVSHGKFKHAQYSWVKIWRHNAANNNEDEILVNEYINYIWFYYKENNNRITKLFSLLHTYSTGWIVNVYTSTLYEIERYSLFIWCRHIISRHEREIYKTK